MSPEPRIAFLNHLPIGIEVLRAEAAEDGFRFLDRLVDEWRSGANRFARPGEVFLGAFRGADLVAVGGLNCDPSTDQAGVGRLRHLYVRRSDRRSGVGSALVRRLLDLGEDAFHTIRLRTDRRDASAFYVSLGFIQAPDATATHLKALRQP